MGKYADKFREGFKGDLEQSKIDKKLSLQRQRLIDANGLGVWKTIHDEAMNAVMDINSSGDRLLTFQPADDREQRGFKIIFRIGDTQRFAEAVYKPAGNMVSISFSPSVGKAQPDLLLKLDLNSSDEVQLVSQGKTYTPEEIVEKMLSGLR